MRGALLAVGLLVLVGCGGKKPADTRGDPPVEGRAAPAPQPDPLASLPQPTGQRYQARTAEDWGRDLLDADERTSAAGAWALQNMGDEGMRFFAAGMKSPLPLVRWHSTNLLPTRVAKKYPDAFEPLLAQLLKDESASVRAAAAGAIRSCEFPNGERLVREAAGVEKDPGAKKTMEGHLQDMTAKR